MPAIWPVRGRANPIWRSTVAPFPRTRSRASCLATLQGKKGFFEQANGGSVLLDEIGEMSPRMQTKLLRFLNDGTFRRVGEDHEVHVDVRVICATQKKPDRAGAKGLFAKISTIASTS